MSNSSVTGTCNYNEMSMKNKMNNNKRFENDDVDNSYDDWEDEDYQEKRPKVRKFKERRAQ